MDCMCALNCVNEIAAKCNNFDKLFKSLKFEKVSHILCTYARTRNPFHLQLNLFTCVCLQVNTRTYCRMIIARIITSDTKYMLRAESCCSYCLFKQLIRMCTKGPSQQHPLWISEGTNVCATKNVPSLHWGHWKHSHEM